MAPVVYGLSKSEFASDPDIAILALQHGLLAAAVSVGHAERVLTFLTNPSLRAGDIHTAIQKAYAKNNVEMVRILLADSRLEKEPVPLRNCAIGKASPELARVLLTSPNVRFNPTKNNILYAAFTPFGAILENWYSRCNMGTLRLLLADPRFTLDQEFCRNICGAVTDILEDGMWYERGELIDIPGFYDRDGNYMSYTNYEELARILRTDTRFAQFTDTHVQWI